jgi:L-amino acid N-acyltransferase YncA
MQEEQEEDVQAERTPSIDNEGPVLIRPHRDDDIEAMLAIYRRHIHRGIEEGVDDSGTPQPDDLRDRRKNLRNRRFPHLVATRDGEVVGYAYVVLFRKRPAYRHTVKHSRSTCITSISAAASGGC